MRVTSQRAAKIRILGQNRRVTAPANISPVKKEPLPLPDIEPEQARIKRAELRKMRIIATSMLIVAAIIFITCHILQRYYDWVWLGFLRAAAEAGMVGGLADWFAVTALSLIHISEPTRPY